MAEIIFYLFKGWSFCVLTDRAFDSHESNAICNADCSMHNTDIVPERTFEKSFKLCDVWNTFYVIVIHNL